MIKFLKTLLFIVIMIFSFALGVKYSHLFLKGDLNIFNETDILFDDKQANQNTDVNNQEETEKIVIEEAPAELSPLTDEEKNDIENLNAGMPDFDGIDESPMVMNKLVQKLMFLNLWMESIIMNWKIQ